MASDKIFSDIRGRLTAKQNKAALLPDELPPCVGNPKTPCPHPVQPVLVAGYDDTLRCTACNKVHIALVEEEAGKSAPNSVRPQTISTRLDAKARAYEIERRRRIEGMLTTVEDGYTDQRTGKWVSGQTRGSRGLRKNTAPSRPALPGEAITMAEASAQRDKFGTLEQGISDAERRRRIVMVCKAKQPK